MPGCGRASAWHPAGVQLVLVRHCHEVASVVSARPDAIAFGDIAGGVGATSVPLACPSWPVHAIVADANSTRHTVARMQLLGGSSRSTIIVELLSRDNRKTRLWLYEAASIDETSVDDFDELFGVNVRAPFFLVQRLLLFMVDGSSIVLISSLPARSACRRSSGWRSLKTSVTSSRSWHRRTPGGSRGISSESMAAHILERLSMQAPQRKGAKSVGSCR